MVVPFLGAVSVISHPLQLQIVLIHVDVQIQTCERCDGDDNNPEDVQDVNWWPTGIKRISDVRSVCDHPRHCNC